MLPEEIVQVLWRQVVFGQNQVNGSVRVQEQIFHFFHPQAVEVADNTHSGVPDEEPVQLACGNREVCCQVVHGQPLVVIEKNQADGIVYGLVWTVGDGSSGGLGGSADFAEEQEHRVFQGLLAAGQGLAEILQHGAEQSLKFPPAVVADVEKGLLAGEKFLQGGKGTGQVPAVFRQKFRREAAIVQLHIFLGAAAEAVRGVRVDNKEVAL